MHLVKLTIEDRSYGLTPMPPMMAVEFAPRVGQLIAEAVGESAVDLIENLRIALAGNDIDLEDMSEEDAEKVESAVMENLSQLGITLLTSVAKANPSKFTALAKEALEFEVWAGNGKLSDSTHFNSWFNEHPQDYFPVAFWAIWEHSKNFFIGSSAGYRAVFGGQVFKSPMNGPQNTSSDAA